MSPRRLWQRWRVRRALRAGARAYLAWAKHYRRVRALWRRRGGMWYGARDDYHRETGVWVRSARHMRDEARRFGLR